MLVHLGLLISWSILLKNKAPDKSFQDNSKWALGAGGIFLASTTVGFPEIDPFVPQNIKYVGCNNWHLIPNKTIVLAKTHYLYERTPANGSKGIQFVPSPITNSPIKWKSIPNL